MDETKVTPESEKIDSPETTTDKKVEGTVDAIIPKEEIKNTNPETVPLATFLSLKEDLKELKKELKESRSTKTETQGYNELTKKYPDVSPDFIQDMLNSATLEAQKKIEEKYSPIIERQEAEKKQLAFDKAFNDLFDKTLQENPDLPKSIDRDAIKAIAVTPKFRNVPLADILIKMYGSTITGKSSSENEMRSGSDRVEDIVSFDKITPGQKKAIMEDPKTRKKYFDWLDTQTGR